jgi:hypothetical protein
LTSLKRLWKARAARSAAISAANSATSATVGSGPGKKFKPRNGAAPDWEGLDVLLGEVRTRQRHAVYLGRHPLEIESFGLCL